MKYIKNIIYILRHKYFVFMEALSFYHIIEDKKFGKLLLKKAISHDMSKFSRHEFKAYANKFFSKNKKPEYKQAFDTAWEHHYSSNAHHPECWIGLTMDDLAVYEMMCDWYAMSRAFGDTPQSFYLLKRLEEKSINHKTRLKVERILGVDRLTDRAWKIIQSTQSESFVTEVLSRNYRWDDDNTQKYSKLHKNSYL